MFAVGHLALGYLTGKATSKPLGLSVNVPLLFFTSIIADIDLLIPEIHRGPTHSLVVYALLFIPLFVFYGKKSLIYFVSLSSHSLLGDFVFTGGAPGVQILWPLSSTWYTGVQTLVVADVLLEWVFFTFFLVILFKTGDLQKLFASHPVNLLLTVPVFTIILPVFLGFPLRVPMVLLIPHLILLGLLSLSILKDLKNILTDKIDRQGNSP